MRYTLEDEKFRETILMSIGAIVILPVILYFLFGGIGIEIFSVIVSSLLSLALIVLYFQQSALLEKQTELMHRDYQSNLLKHGKIVADDDTVRLKIRNAGRGKVRRMFLKCVITSDTGSVDVDSGRVTTRSVEDGSQEVESDSEWEDYEAEVRFRIPSIETTDDDRGFPFKMLAKQLSHEGIDSATIELTLEVIDEGFPERDFSYTKVIAKQEIEIPGPVTENIDGEKRTRHSSTSLEKALGSKFSSSRDINPVSVEELAERHSVIEAGSK